MGVGGMTYKKGRRILFSICKDKIFVLCLGVCVVRLLLYLNYVFKYNYLQLLLDQKSVSAKEKDGSHFNLYFILHKFLFLFYFS